VAQLLPVKVPAHTICRSCGVIRENPNRGGLGTIHAFNDLARSPRNNCGARPHGSRAGISRQFACDGNRHAALAYEGNDCQGKQRKPEVVDESILQAVSIAEKIAPYRHARLSAVKLAGDPNNPLRLKDDATADELREEIMHRLGVLVDGGVLDLGELLAPKRRIAN
jgi:hypothetical protein